MSCFDAAVVFPPIPSLLGSYLLRFFSLRCCFNKRKIQMIQFCHKIISVYERKASSFHHVSHQDVQPTRRLCTERRVVPPPQAQKKTPTDKRYLGTHKHAEHRPLSLEICRVGTLAVQQDRMEVNASPNKKKFFFFNLTFCGFDELSLISVWFALCPPGFCSSPHEMLRRPSITVHQRAPQSTPTKPHQSGDALKTAQTEANSSPTDTLSSSMSPQCLLQLLLLQQSMNVNRV